VIVNEKSLLLEPEESEAVIVNLNVPELEGVPPITAMF
jgi:hypothetical protein